ncbi:MAG: serine/threonine-protein kinase [Thermoguttaceae bacterium]
MNDQPEPGVPRQELLSEVLASYLEAVARGEIPDRDVLVAHHPELAEDLATFFQDHDCATRLADTWRTSEGADAETIAGRGQRPTSKPCDPTISWEFSTSDPQPAQIDSQSDAAQRSHRLGDYKILDEIARGGMGVVYKAHQISLNRIVAVKMILSGQLADEAEIARFRIEAEAAANLQHPNIVGIHEVGQQAGQHYFSMEYVAGQSLAQLVRNGPLPPKQAARYVQQVAEAIDYAHGHGVTHRDIKPSNVLIDEKDMARVTDFGLAKRMHSDQRLTATNQIVGTALYMAPEQVLGSRAHIGPASDVYSIGALFYELLTGQPPFHGSNTLETLVQVREHLPKLPRQLNPHTPRELEMICLKCLEKDPNNRYRSARDLADDLKRFLNADSISISGPNLLNRLVRTLERSHHDVEFRAWANMLFHFAWIIFAAHLLIFLAGQIRLPAPLVWLAVFRGLEFAGMALVFWLYRAGWYPPQGRPARQLWALWLGYAVGSMVLMLVEYTMAVPDRPIEHWMLYPRLAILCSLGFIMMGSSYWGYCYGIGAGFLLLALVMPLNPPLAPLVFGLGWGTSLLVLGRHLGKLAQET